MGGDMATMIERIKARAWVAHVDDERDTGSGYMVCLADEYVFAVDPGCGVRGFDTLREVEKETRRCNVVKSRSASGLRAAPHQEHPQSGT